MQPIIFMNPRRKARKVRAKSRRRSKRRAAPAVFANPTRRKRRRISMRGIRRRARRNPIIPTGFVNGQLIPAAQGAAGALALDLALGYLPIPENFKTGALRHVTKGLLAVGIGMGVEKLTSRAAGRAATLGALTVVLHDAAREGVAAFVPSVKLGEYLSDADLAEYLSGGGQDALGWETSAPIVGSESFDDGAGVVAGYGTSYD